MKPSIWIEDGVSLFLLEDEGILLSEGRQEIYALNTAATYVWCCLEEGMNSGQISAARRAEGAGTVVSQLRRSASHTREDFESVTYLNPPAASFSYDWNRTYPAGWIVFPQYSPHAATELRPIGKGEALARLMKEVLVVDTLLDKRIVRSLMRWIQGTDCYELPNSSLPEAVQVISRLLKSSA